jgi:apolipoprotein N-acyltransferase
MKVASALWPDMRTPGKTENLLYAVLSGLLLTASFPPAKLEWIAWFALVPLLKSIRGSRPVQAFKLGFVAGFVHFMTLVYWVVFVMGHYGHLHWTVALSILVLFALYLGLYPACFSLLFSFLRGSRFVSFKSAGAWVGLEYIRSFLLSGFPWCLLGYSQFQRLEVIQIADLAGVYGVSFLIVLVNTLVYALLVDRSFPVKGSMRWELPLVMVTTAAILAYGLHHLYPRGGQRRDTGSVLVAVIQGNIDQAVKWDPEYQGKTVQTYRRLTLSTSSRKPELVVWPETSVPFFFQDDGVLGRQVVAISKEMGAYLLFGSPAYKLEGRVPVFYNRAYMISPEAKLSGTYDKVHLVPFGEYVPLKRVLFFAKRLVASAGDFASGENPAPIGPPRLSVGVLICYESIFPELARAQVLKGAQILANLTNDAWFGMTSAPYQHFSMAVFRAVENRRPLVRAANTGFSGFISAKGEIMKRGDLFREEALLARLPLENSTFTVYTRYGDFFAVMLLILSLINLLYVLWYDFKKRPHGIPS